MSGRKHEKCKKWIALGQINREDPTFSKWKKTFLSQVFPGRWFTRTCHPASLWELLCCRSDCQSAGWVAHPDGYVVDNKRSSFVSRTLNHHNCAVKNDFPNLILTWWSHQSVISFAGVEPAQVQERVENHLKNLLIKHFDPQKADSIFTVEGEVRFSSSLFTIGLLINNIIKKVAPCNSTCYFLVFLDSCLAGADDSAHNLERSFLQAGRGSPRLPDAQLHCKGKVL